jgi:hypothetical protein
MESASDPMLTYRREKGEVRWALELDNYLGSKTYTFLSGNKALPDFFPIRLDLSMLFKLLNTSTKPFFQRAFHGTSWYRLLLQLAQP